MFPRKQLLCFLNFILQIDYFFFKNVVLKLTNILNSIFSKNLMTYKVADKINVRTAPCIFNLYFTRHLTVSKLKFLKITNSNAIYILYQLA